MKLSRRQVRCKYSTVPVLHFEDQHLTSYAGLFLFQLLFARLALRERLRACFRHWPSGRASTSSYTSPTQTQVRLVTPLERPSWRKSG